MASLPCQRYAINTQQRTGIYELGLVALQAGEALGVEYERPPAREFFPSQVEQRPAVAAGEDLPGDRRRPGNNFVGKLAKFLGVHDPELEEGVGGGLGLDLDCSRLLAT